MLDSSFDGARQCLPCRRSERQELDDPTAGHGRRRDRWRSVARLPLLFSSSKAGHVKRLASKEHFEASQRFEISDSVDITRMFPRDDHQARSITGSIRWLSLTPTSRSGASRKKISPLKFNFQSVPGCAPAARIARIASAESLSWLGMMQDYRPRTWPSRKLQKKRYPYGSH